MTAAAQTAEVNGYRTCFDRAGTGPPVLFVHGGFASLDSRFADRSWGYWEHDLASSVELVTYDRRGCYAASCPPDGYDLENQAADAVALLDDLDVSAAHLVGSSAGGPISLAIAAGRPDRVRSLTLVGTAVDMWRPLPGDHVRPVIEHALDLLDERGAEASLAARPEGAELTYETLFMLDEAIERGEAEAFRERHRARVDAAADVPLADRLAYHVAELRNLEAYFDDDAREYAAAVDAPTLVLHGARDRAIPVEWGRELAALVPGAELHEFADRSHGLMQRSPEARQAACEFIAACDRS